MSARVSALLVWLLVAAAAVGWALRTMGGGAEWPAGTAVARIQPPALADLSPLLGRPVPAAVAPAPVAAPADDRFDLLGVVAGPGARRGGVAVIAARGQPPRSVRVGGEVAPGVQLVSVDRRSAELREGSGRQIVLRLPDVPMARRGSPEEPGSVAAPPGAAAGQRPPVFGAPGNPAARPPSRAPAGPTPSSPPAAAQGQVDPATGEVATEAGQGEVTPGQRPGLPLR